MKICICLLTAIAALAVCDAFGQKTFDYKETFPPLLIVENLETFELSELAFPIIDGSLLIPGRIKLSYFSERIALEVVQGNKVAEYDVMAVFEFKDWFSTTGKDFKIFDDALPKISRDEEVPDYTFFKQRMWVKGLIYAARKYQDAGKKLFRVDGFRVRFEEVGDLIRPSVVLYVKRKGPSPFQIMQKDVRNLEKDLGTVSSKVGTLDTSVKSLNSELSSVKRDLNNVTSEVRILSGKIDN